MTRVAVFWTGVFKSFAGSVLVVMFPLIKKSSHFLLVPERCRLDAIRATFV